MPKSLPIDIFLAKKGVLPVIDVRSPGEFAHGHIPGAINLPLFSDEERAKVGTVYKKDGREQAILLGFELVGPKMADFSRKGMELAVAKRILVHCWRGGMRSGVVAWVFETVGLEVFTLQKGYKAYRNFVLKEFEKPLNLRIVGGETGTGKTEILHALRKKGEQVIDLEAIAAHRGSAFGALGQPAQPTSEQFENDLHHAISELDPAKIIWIE
ncbi:MAG TPA: tRNA 2-selenouridine(34) synthase MnmH, partial [Bacteroidia bacterium]|nr:tRNA 2-selenouridine(34) synthase MnmH [Bacteroidia bacterium]